MRERNVQRLCPLRELQGDFFVHAEAELRVALGGAEGLDKLLVAACPVLEWQAVISAAPP
ncbi:hypothetical protein P2Q00_42780 [Streptomyces coacervatus]|nr:hypothetical protein [Streptomyces coacervatus]MDF2272091.1 hypothetical protein [Streptomyces coacervatus]